jgi:hypothetical protein
MTVQQRDDVLFAAAFINRRFVDPRIVKSVKDVVRAFDAEPARAVTNQHRESITVDRVDLAALIGECMEGEAEFCSCEECRAYLDATARLRAALDADT